MYPDVVKEERTNATVPGGPVILEISVVAENIFVTFFTPYNLLRRTRKHMVKEERTDHRPRRAHNFKQNFVISEDKALILLHPF